MLGSSATKLTVYGYKSTGAAQLPCGNQGNKKLQLDSHEKSLKAPYVEFDEDGKSNKSYAIESIQPQSAWFSEAGVEEHVSIT